jgi:hypothetical protein
MPALRSFLLVPCILLLSAATGLAQAPSGPAPANPEHGYIIVFAGGAVSDTTTPTFGVEIGEHVTRQVQAYLTLTYFDNLIRDEAVSALDALAADLTATTGLPWQFDGRDRGLALSVGGKYLFSTDGAARPYIGGAAGFVNLKRTIHEIDLGDVTEDILETYGAPDGGIDPMQSSTFKPMLEAAPGVSFVNGRLYVDVSYRFRKIFRSREPFYVSEVHVGVGMGF